MVPPRVQKAMWAMEGIGILREKVKPVLKNLLKLYDNNWELIEEENYRVLADAIFDLQEQEVQKKQVEKFDTTEDQHEEHWIKGTSNSGTMAGESSSKRRKLDDTILFQTCLSQENIQQTTEDQHEKHWINGNSNSGTMAGESSLKRRKSDDTILPQTCLGQENTEFVSPQDQSYAQANEMELDSNQALVREEKIEQVQPLTSDREKRNEVVKHESNFREQTVEPYLPNVVHHKKGLMTDGPSNQNCLKEPNVEADIDPLLENGVNNRNCSSSVMPPLGSSSIRKTSCSLKGDSTKQRDPVEVLASRNVDGTDGRKGEQNVTCKNGTIPVHMSEHIEVASSTSGEVKLSLIWKPVVGHSNFHMPNLNLVLKMVEDQYLKSYTIVEPNFSVMKLMQEFCQCFLELGTDYSHCQAEREVNLDQSFGSLRELNLGNVLGSKSNTSNGNSIIPASSLDGFPDLHQSSEVLVPEASSSLACNGMDGPCGNSQQKCKASIVSSGGRNKKKLKGTGISIVNHCSLENIPFDKVNPIHDVNDISKGEERVRISVVKKVGSEPYPPSFYYIPQNIVYQNGYLNFSLARIGDEHCCSDCFGDCLLSSIPCPCARETGGEYAYTLEGKLKKEFLDECIFARQDPQKHHFFYCKDCPLERSKNEIQPDTCKGHLVRKFIKECWSKCGCNKQCGNRVVQRGITCNLQVFFMSEEKGWGVRTLEELPRGSFVCEYVGEVLTNMELYDRTVQKTGNDRHTYPVLLDADWGSEGVLKDDDALCLDATFHGNVARFINHRCTDANLLEIPVEVETPDHHYYHLAFFTTRKVEAMEELTWDYGIDFDDHSHPVKAFRCCCGSKYCRDVKRRTRSKQRV